MRRLVPLAFAAALAIVPSSVLGQVNLGGQVNWGTDNAGLALGARLSWVLPFETGTSMIGTFDYFFPDDFDLWEVNINLAHTFPVNIEDFGPYVGAGFNWAHLSNLGPFDRTDDRFGMNVLGGVKYFLSSVTPYGEVRAELGGGKRWVFTAGVLFDIGVD